MDDQKLEEIWKEMVQETFNKFIEEYVGYDTKSAKPECYGSGDDRPWCSHCILKATC